MLTPAILAILHLDESMNDLKGVFYLLIAAVGIGALLQAFRGHLKTAGLMAVGCILGIVILWMATNPGRLDNAVGNSLCQLLGC